LGDSLINKKDEWFTQYPQRIVELGSGTGVTGLMIAKAFPNSTVHLTDLPILLPLLEKNTKGCDNATFGVLEWGKPVNETYDVILGADVVAGIYDSQGLAKTIYDLSHERTRVYLSTRDRLSGLIETFLANLQVYFTNVETSQPQSDNQAPNVSIIYVSGKRRFQ
jgi:hypothetical protein